MHEDARGYWGFCATRVGEPLKAENEGSIDKLVDAYNAQNARAFADLFAVNAIHGCIAVRA
jgi:hypothetical protein